MNSEFKVILLIQNSLKAYTYLITLFMRDYSKVKDSNEIHQKGRRKKNRELGENEFEINQITQI